MRNTIFGILLFASGILFFSCQDSFEEHEVGKDLINSDNSVFVTDTVLIKSSTVKLDSIITSNTSLIGSYHDEFLGKIKSDAYFRIKPKSSFVLTDEYNPVLDSVVVIFKPTSYYYGDTLKKQSLKVFLVEEEMKNKFDKDVNFYNTQSFKISSQVASIDDAATFPKGYRDEMRDQDIRLKIEGETGEAFINTVFKEAFKIGLDNRINNYYRWKELSHGICIKASDENANIFSMTPESFKLRFYYHDDISEPITKEQEEKDTSGISEKGSHKIFDFQLNTEVQFSNISSDRSNTPLENLVKQNQEIKSIDTYNTYKNVSFIQAGVGLLTKINFPSVRELNKLGFDRTLLKAELIFYPLLNTQNNNERRLPILFYLNQTNSKNEQLGYLMKSKSAKLSSTFVPSDQSELESYFSFDLTSHINLLLTDNDRNDASLLITPNNLNTSFNRMILSNTGSNKRRIKLKLTYVVHE